MSNLDNEIERGVYQTPSNDDDLYDDYDDEDGFGRGPVFAIFAVIVLAAFVGVVWLAYQQGLRQGQQTAPPIITASDEPFKVEPDDPQGMAQPEASITDDALAGQPLEQVATVTSSSEAPIEVPQSRSEVVASNAIPETTPELRTTRPTTTQPATGSSGGLVVPPPSSRVQNAAVDENLQTASSAPVTRQPQPQAQVQTRQPVTQQPVTQQASPEPRVQSAAATQGPPAPGANTPSLTGNNVVQVASFPNRADADAAWARLQSRHAAIVGPYSQDVQSVDLGDRGTWFRLRFGYFEGRSNASAVCDQLKAAGQDCLVASR